MVSAGAELGAFISYGADVNATIKRASYYVDRILKGTPPGALPIERASTLKLTVNLKVASLLGVEVPEALLNRADEVVR